MDVNREIEATSMKTLDFSSDRTDSWDIFLENSRITVDNR